MIHNPTVLFTLLLALDAHAASVGVSYVMGFEDSSKFSNSNRYEDDGLVFETTVNNVGVQTGTMALRNPGPGFLNANGLNTVPYNGTAYAVPFTNSLVRLSTSGTEGFALYSVDLGLYSASFGFNMMTVQFQATTKSGLTLVEAFDIAGPVVGQYSDFQTMNFPVEWNNLDEVVIGSFYTIDPIYGFTYGFSIDNVSFSVVPEPSSILLAGFGFLSMALHRQRHRNGCQDGSDFAIDGMESKRRARTRPLDSAGEA